MLHSRLAFAGLSIGVLLLSGGHAAAVPIRTLSELQSVTIYERSGGSQPDAKVFSPNGSQVLQRIVSLGAAANDFLGVPTEYYDLYYSDVAGSPDPDGAYLTVDALFTSSNDTGFNVADVVLVFPGGVEERAERYTRVNAVDPLAFPATASNAIDGDRQTHTSLGNSTDQQNRLSMTFGFASSVPEPSAVLCMALACSGLLVARKRNSAENVQ